MISFACSGCGKQVKVQDELAGKQGKCPGCRQAITVPALLVNREGPPAAEEAKTGEEEKRTSMLTKVLATVFGAVLAPVLVAVIVKWADPSVWTHLPATQASSPAAPPSPRPPEAGLPEAKPPEKLPPKFTSGLGMEFVLVPKGTAWLGGGGGKPGQKEVAIPQDFYLGQYEVTQEEWQKVTGGNPSMFARTGKYKNRVQDFSDEELKRFPVDMVSWDNVQRFLLELNKREKQPGWIYRLPREAEWEYACRGGPAADKSESAFFFYFDKPTNQLQPGQANIGPRRGFNPAGRPCKVGSYKPNRLGLYDMHGNVWEWCDDADNAPDGSPARVTRGGNWYGDSGYCQAAFRIASPPSGRNNNLGLRLARVPAGKEGK